MCLAPRLMRADNGDDYFITLTVRESRTYRSSKVCRGLRGGAVNAGRDGGREAKGFSATGSLKES